jgi:hypothetical protein
MAMDLNKRQQMLAYTTLMAEGENGAPLFHFLPPEEGAGLKEFSEKVWSEKKEGGAKVIVQKIKEVLVQRQISILNEVHPGWIVECLRDESPRVLGVLCRYLPGETVKYLMKNLPQKKAQQLPKMSEVFALSPELILWVKGLIEKKFAHPSLPEPGMAFSFAHIGWMNRHDLEVLLRDLGLEEVRRAFSKVDFQSLKVFFSRFSAQDTRELKARIVDAPACSADEKKRAQKHLVNMEMQALDAETLFTEIGLSYFSQTILPHESQWAEAICQKLSPQDGYVLKRFIEEKAEKVSEAEVGRFREDVLKRVFVLTEQGKMRKYWQESSEHEETNSYTIL